MLCLNGFELNSRWVSVFKFIVRDAGVFPGIWFDFIHPYNSYYSFLFLRYMLQPIRIRITALSCFETNIYLRVFTCTYVLTHSR